MIKKYFSSGIYPDFTHEVLICHKDCYGKYCYTSFNTNYKFNEYDGNSIVLSNELENTIRIILSPIWWCYLPELVRLLDKE